MIVTKEYLKEKIASNPSHVIGRALVAIFRNQTESERVNNTTRIKNGIGFTGTDGRIGAITAKYFIKHGTLLDWQVKNWLKPNRAGEPRILKYAKQLDSIANSTNSQSGSVGPKIQQYPRRRRYRPYTQYS